MYLSLIRNRILSNSIRQKTNLIFSTNSLHGYDRRLCDSHANKKMLASDASMNFWNGYEDIYFLFIFEFISNTKNI